MVTTKHTKRCFSLFLWPLHSLKRSVCSLLEVLAELGACRSDSSEKMMLFCEGMLPLKQVAEHRSTGSIHQCSLYTETFSNIVHCNGFLIVSRAVCIVACSVCAIRSRIG